jgi:hypothetical protein
MDLSNEDALRLNVMLKNVTAVRIDENNMVVHGLSDRGEARVALNPNCRADRYLKIVREFLSGTVLGSPGGYPVYLKRWTRMGDIKATALAELLMLGEPEAVTAVVSALGLTEDLARRAWWAYPEADIARRLLTRECVYASPFGSELAEFLIDYLPFETDHHAILETVRLVLTPTLIDTQARRALWEKGALKNTYRIGFLRAAPDDLPDAAPARAELEAHRDTLAGLAASGNAVADLLMRVLDSPGQTFVATAEDVLASPADQNVVVALLNAVADYFADARFIDVQSREIAEIVDAARALSAEGLQGTSRHPALNELLAAVPELASEVTAMLVLARADEHVVIPIFAQTDAVGTVMRTKLEPVTTPIFEQFAILRAAESAANQRRGRRRRR